ncbi:MAG: DUF4093 domain-containing protein [Clostridia bacterium]|nr:DUF4093 domain-containing protein [Clostridia bacterium]
MEKLALDRSVIVEGKYDKNTLSQVIDAMIIPVGGFGVFHKTELRELLVKLAGEKGVIVLTDSDGGGKQIRAYLSQILPKDKVTHLFIPCIKGKEKRKDKASKSGLLGVEGMEAQVLRDLFAPFAADAKPKETVALTKAQFYADGFSGKENSAQRRAALAKEMGLPEDLSANALLACINLFLSEAEYEAFKNGNNEL